ncbi:MAG: glycosyltransferase [Spirochaetes bacterium]|nr:glycosyltransferase [Spirochaetota bacterium]
MYSTALGASVCSKQFRKKRETKRVLYVTDSTRISGGGRQLLNNVAAMSACGVQPHVIAPPNSPMASALDSTGTSVIPWESPRRLFRSALFLANVVRSHQIDVVHTFHSRPGKVAVLAKLLGGRFRLYLNRGVIYPPNPLMGLCAAIADGVICNSHASANVLKAYGTPKNLYPTASRRTTMSHGVGARTPSTRWKSMPLPPTRRCCTHCPEWTYSS